MTPAVDTVIQAGIFYRIHEYRGPAGLGYGEQAAQALALNPARVLKTLVAIGAGRYVVALVPVDAQLDLRVLARLTGQKRMALAPVRDAQRVTGYLPGGISPLGQKQQLPTWLDESAGGFTTIFVSGGRRGLELELRPHDLERLTSARAARLTRPS